MAELQQQVVEYLQDGAERAGVPVGCGAAGAGQGAEAAMRLAACGAGAGARDRVVASYVQAYDGGGRLDEEA